MAQELLLLVLLLTAPLAGAKSETLAEVSRGPTTSPEGSSKLQCIATSLPSGIIIIPRS